VSGVHDAGVGGGGGEEGEGEGGDEVGERGQKDKR
jgi:hypothetical protein